jgi:putative membrane protein
MTANTTATASAAPDPIPPRQPKRPSRYLKILWTCFAVYWAAWAIRPKYFGNWVVENTLLVVFVAFLFFTRRRFRLSNVSYTLIVVFLALHTIGAHYSYSEVPYNDWWRAVFGRPLHEGRNTFDRLVHFCFGLLLAYPIREMFLRIARVRGFWGYYLPLDVTMSFSMLYELIEWAYAAIAGGAAGTAFLGTQGDEWDAQKDMAMATLGGLIAMCVVAFVNWKFDKDFAEEFRQSLAIPDGDRPLGERRLAELKGRPG